MITRSIHWRNCSLTVSDLIFEKFMPVVCMIFVIFMIIIFIMGIAERKSEKKKNTEKILKDFGRVIPGKGAPKPSCDLYMKFVNDKNIFVIDEITRNDIGFNELFKCVNRTYSSAGESVLLEKLLTSKLNDNKKIKDFDEAVMAFEDEHLMTDTALKLMELGKEKGKDPLLFFEMKELDKKGSIYYYLLFLIYLIGIALLFFNTGAGIILLTVNIAVSVVVYFKNKAGIYSYVRPAFYLLKLLKTGNELENGPLADNKSSLILGNIKGIDECIRKSGNIFFGSGYISLSSETSKSIFGAVAEYINMLFHIDILLFYGIYKKITDRKDIFIRLYGYIGNIDTYISVLSYRKSIENWCVPDISDDDMTIKSLYHPMIECPVKNDCSFEKGLLVTGSNASGKSTFLKACALNIMFAQSIATVCGDSYTMPYLHLYTSMKVSDNLFTKDSFFLAEIKSIKRILDAVEEINESKENTYRVACFIDEIFKGTNTIERVAASSQVIKSLSDKKVIFATASHDTELTYILEDFVRNVHFEEKEDTDDVVFTYKLSQGPSTSRNAIRLLGRLGIESNITEKALKMTEEFSKTNKWSLAD